MWTGTAYTLWVLQAVVALPKAGSSEFVVEKSPLSNIRHPRVNVVDITFDSDGSVLVATTDGLITTPVQVQIFRRV